MTTLQENIWIELIKGLVTLISVGIVGTGLTAFWTKRQKRRESDTAELAKLYELYGTYLSIRRMWNVFKKESTISPPPTATHRQPMGLP